MSDTQGKCETESLQPTWVTIGFASLSFVMLIVTIVFSVKHVKSAPSQRRRTVTTKTRESKAVDTNENIKDEKAIDEHIVKVDIDADQEEAKLKENQESNCETSKKEDENPPHSLEAFVSAAIEAAKEEDATATHDYKPVETNDIDDKKDVSDDDMEEDSTENGHGTNQSMAKSEWDNASGCMGKFKLCARDVWGRKSVYLPIISHLSDTTTDFASVVEFGIVASTSNPIDCGVNVWYLFALSILCMVTYRVISSFKVYQITRSPRRALFQMLDIEIFRILYLSHYMGLKGKSSPHRLLCVLEAVFEAAPQSVIQLVYLMFTRIRSPIIMTSCILSFFNLTLSIISDDAKLLQIEYAKPSLEAVPHKTRKKEIGGEPIMHHRFLEFVLLYTFRVLDVPSQLLIYAFLWYYVHGVVCFAVLGINIIIALALYCKTQNTDTLLSVIALPFALQKHAFARKYWLFSLVESIILIIIIWSGVAARKGGDIIGLWVFCFLATLLKWMVGTAFLYYYLRCPRWKEINAHAGEGYKWWEQLKHSLEWDTDNHFRELVQLSRERADLDSLLTQGKYVDSMELIMFRHSSVSQAANKLHGEQTKYSLLAIAMGVFDDNPQMFDTVWREGADNDITDDKYTTALMIAAKMENSEYVKLLLNEKWMNLDYILKETHDMQSKSYITALYHANHDNSKSDMLQRMLDKICTLYSDTIESGEPYTFKMQYNFSSIISVEYYSMLAIAAEHNHEKLFSLILQNDGLDLRDEECVTALAASVPEYMNLSFTGGSYREHFVKMIFNASDINVEYIQMSGALSRAIDVGWSYSTPLHFLMECVDKWLQNDDGAEQKRIDILNTVDVKRQNTAFHAICYMQSPDYSTLETISNWYGSASNVKEALRRRVNDGSTALMLCREALKHNTESAQELRRIEKFMLNNM